MALEMSKRAISSEDLYSMRWLNNPQISPDGSKILFEQKTVDQESKNSYCNQIWLANVQERSVAPFTSGPSDFSPKWSPDGSKVAFVSTRSGASQIWVINAAGGEAQQLTYAKQAFSSISWSPDGRYLAAVAMINENADSPGSVSDVKIIRSLLYKLNGVGITEAHYSHIFIINAQNGEVEQVTDGPYNHSAPYWAPDGSKLLLVGKRYPEAEYMVGSDIYELEISTRIIRPMVRERAEVGRSLPLYSRDGRRIACLGSFGNTRVPATKVCLLNNSEVGYQDLLTDFDLVAMNGVTSDMVPQSFLQPIWSADDRWIFFVATEGGSTRLYKVASEGGIPVALTQAGQTVYAFDYCPQNNTIAVLVSSTKEICALNLLMNDGQEQICLLEANKDLLEQVWVSKPEEFTFIADNGATVEGWLLRPKNIGKEEKVPLILEIHGGPHLAYGEAFYHEMQVFCAQGYAVLFCNPQGSLGYGEDFMAAAGDYVRDQDYRDIMRAVDEALIRWPFLDPQRIGITGGSYGGFITNWAISHSNRFRVAITDRSIVNRMSTFGTADATVTMYFPRSNANIPSIKPPWQDAESCLSSSPLMYVENINTPLMIIHSEEDMRAPIEQAEQLYTALKWLKKDVVFVRFPRENHDLTRTGQPRHRVERLNLMIKWFKEHFACEAEKPVTK